jgi:hypothetical protein
MVTGKWADNGRMWISDDREWYLEISPVANNEFEIRCCGDEWTFEDTVYGGLDRVQAYGLDVLNGVADAVAGAKSRMGR